MRHVFIMDPLEGVKPWKDTTYFLMLAAAQRGHEVYVTAQTDLSLRHGTTVAESRRVAVSANPEAPFRVESRQTLELASADVVWERTDPPVDRRYLYTSLMLDFLPPRTIVVNRPAAIRGWNEKLAALKFPEFTPPTLVSAGSGEIEKFLEQHGRITLKPIDGHGGKGIEFCNHDSPDRDAQIDRVTAGGRRWVIAQRYLESARDGDKRILLLDGEPIGAILRLHAEGQELNNLDAGGTANPTLLTERDLEICGAMADSLRESGIVFAGIDIIGGMLIEVNVTSPTGLQEASRFSNRDLHHTIMSALETAAADR